MERALAEAVRLVEAQGHTVVQLTPEECQVAFAQEVAGGLFSLDPSGANLVMSSGEPFIPSLLAIGARARQWKATLPDISTLDRLGKFGFLEKKRAEIEESWRNIWEQHGLDAVLAPAAQTTAIEHDKYTLAPYTSLLNLHNVSVLICKDMITDYCVDLKLTRLAVSFVCHTFWPCHH